MGRTVIQTRVVEWSSDKVSVSCVMAVTVVVAVCSVVERRAVTRREDVAPVYRPNSTYLDEHRYLVYSIG